jgi:hypothetical protein
MAIGGHGQSPGRSDSVSRGLGSIRCNFAPIICSSKPEQSDWQVSSSTFELQARIDRIAYSLDKGLGPHQPA